MNINDNCFFRIINYGLFVAKFSLSYTYQGATRLVSSGDFPIGQTRQINVPCDATDIFLKVEIAVFFGTYKTVFQGTYKTADQKCFIVYGYTFAPYFLQIRCDANIEQYSSQINQQLNYSLSNSQLMNCPTLCTSYPYFFHYPSPSNPPCS